MLACVREGLAAVSDELCSGARGGGPAPVALGDGAVDVRRVPELGLVGEPARRAAGAIRAALAGGPRPRRRPARARRTTARSCNVNADDAAAAIATALAADELVFLSDVPGVLDEQGAVIPHISASRPPASASGGMLPEARGLRRPRCSAASPACSIGVAGTVVTP